ncbi:pyrimidine operon attenuation protein/uracil phosphoribosyltransferase [Natranaerovirga hydrolytica]|uniref:Bifunctional protein PyrR n=1 Tax=Natranaerovirga hydrolytica TaxID=680378 RepID=A0A4R1MZR2_9FIRM|nr:bifunctional pyr operon transcriptional regulator/uracil phosphoribosyltransferase PyrR [Natranaerovirga hydrolytica]TCK98110.1 pyrimidine operon attenuation protein/uracil phosphoribosyltransferase [Natranaerovirga hydrolytica]
MDKVLLDEKAINRALTRISHEIIEKNKGVDDIVILGIKTRGVPLANRIVSKMERFEEEKIPFDVLDITFYRDDLEQKSAQPEVHNHLNIFVENKTVILIDDVIYTGRTLRAAIDAVIDVGRPNKIQFAALIDRGHRELPLRPDYVGKNIPTSKEEIVQVKLKEEDGIDEVILKENKK